MTHDFKIPWAAWREPKYLELKFPESWDVSEYKMKRWNAPELNDEQIKNAILNPIGTPQLSELAEGKKSAVIVVDDMTRTTPAYKVLPHVLDKLTIANIRNDDITILLALGAHKPMNRKDLILKLGEDIVNSFNIENHHPYENLVKLGESSKGTPIEVNKTYYDADLKISLGGVIPHPLAGFGGGAKIVLPGVSGIRTLEANHSAAMRGVGAGLGRMTGVREDIEEIAEKVGLDFTINILFNEIGDIAAMTSGHFKNAHREAMRLAEEHYKTNITLNNQICFFNCFPEDSELNQSMKGLNLLMTAPNKMLDRKGEIVLMSSCYEGRGYHSLLAETGSRLFTNFGDSVIWRAFIKRRSVSFFSPNLSESDLYHLFPKSVDLFNNWNDLTEHLTEKYGESAKAALIPTSIQLT